MGSLPSGLAGKLSDRQSNAHTPYSLWMSRLESCPRHQNSYPEVLTPSTSEHDLIWK